MFLDEVNNPENQLSKKCILSLNFVGGHTLIKFHGLLVFEGL